MITRRGLLRTGLMSFCAIALSSCDNIERSTSSYPLIGSLEHASYCALETQGDFPHSRAIFFDESLEKVATLELPFAMISNGVTVSQVFERSICIAPKGINGIAADHYIRLISAVNGRVSSYDVQVSSLEECGCNSQYVFSLNNLNGCMNVIRVNRQTGDLKKIEIKKEHDCSLICTTDDVIIFSQSDSNFDNCYLTHYSLDLEEIKKVQLEPKYVVVFRPKLIGDRIFFPWYSSSSEPSKDRGFGIYDVKKKEIQYIQTGKLVYEISGIGDKILVVNQPWNGSSSSNTSLQLYSIEGEALSNPTEIDHHVNAITADETSLVIQSEFTLRKYKVENLKISNEPLFEKIIQKQGREYTFISDFLDIR